MKTSFIFALSSYICAAIASAGVVNIVHVGSKDVVKFQVTAGDASMDFTLAHGASTGSFDLPSEDATIKAFHDEIPELKVPASEAPRIAILFPTDEGFEWKLLEAKPTEDKWAFRIMNFSGDTANVISNRKLVEIPARQEKSLDVSGSGQINLKIPNTVDLSYPGSDPTGVVAFIYREDEEWRGILIPDR